MNGELLIGPRYGRRPARGARGRPLRALDLLCLDELGFLYPPSRAMAVPPSSLRTRSAIVLATPVVSATESVCGGGFIREQARWAMACSDHGMPW